MDPPGDRLEVPDIESERPQVTIPSDNVQRMVRIDVARNLSSGLDAHLELALLVVGRQPLGRTDVALRVGGAFEKLAILIDIALGRLDMSAHTLDDEHALADVPVREKAPDDARWNDEIIARAVRERAELRLDRAGSLVHEEHLVPVRVAVPVAHGLRGAHHREHNVLVPHQGQTPLHGVAVCSSR